MKIMLCYDGSAASKKALEVAEQQARAYGGELWVVTSLQAEAGTAHLFKEEIIEAEAHLEKIRETLKGKNIPCETHLLQRGLEPGDDLLSFAKENEIDQIVIGIRNRSRVGKLLLGSVAQYIILKADRPVISI